LKFQIPILNPKKTNYKLQKLKSKPQHYNSVLKLEFGFFILEFKLVILAKKLNHEQEHHLNESGNRA
jgi:hypothetical protein